MGGVETNLWPSQHPLRSSPSPPEFIIGPRCARTRWRGQAPAGIQLFLFQRTGSSAFAEDDRVLVGAHCPPARGQAPAGNERSRNQPLALAASSPVIPAKAGIQLFLSCFKELGPPPSRRTTEYWSSALPACAGTSSGGDPALLSCFKELGPPPSRRTTEYRSERIAFHSRSSPSPPEFIIGPRCARTRWRGQAPTGIQLREVLDPRLRGDDRKLSRA